MSTLIHADIFFFVTTIAVVLIASLFIVVIIYVVRILNDLHYISGVVRKETDLIAADIEEMREDMKGQGFFQGLYSVILGLFRARKRSEVKKPHNSKDKKK